MTDTELIAKQAKQIEELKVAVATMRHAIATVRGRIYCIGGPLNDNKLGFSHEQKKLFHSIVSSLNVANDEEIPW
jgi:hypothetical protein